MKRYTVNIRVRETRVLELEAENKTEAIFFALEHPDHKHTTFDRNVSIGTIRNGQGRVI